MDMLCHCLLRLSNFLDTYHLATLRGGHCLNRWDWATETNECGTVGDPIWDSGRPGLIHLGLKPGLNLHAACRLVSLL